jgi:hypothetical protein
MWSLSLPGDERAKLKEQRLPNTTLQILLFPEHFVETLLATSLPVVPENPWPAGAAGRDVASYVSTK